MINSRSVSVTEEKRIAVALITSERFAKEILPILDLDYFVNSYLKIIASWGIAFFEEHGKVANKHIKDIYESEAHRIKETDAELISDLLGLLSDQYDPDSVNVEYLKDCAVGYFRRRELEIVVNNVSVLKDKEEYDEAEQQIEKFTKVALELDSGSLINIGDVNQVIEIYEEREKEDKNFFQLPGDLGRYLGPFKRGDLIGYYAPAKRGKSFTLVDHFKHLVLQKRKTIFWSIEMTRTEITPRIMKAFHPMVEEAGVYSFPTFDCIKNQAGECVDRASKVIVLDGDELIEDPNHVPCTKCMRGGKHDFTMTIYYDKIYREQDDIFTVTDMLSGTKRAPGISSILGRCGRLSVHKKYTLTYDKMMRDIEVLHAQDGFVPDAFVLDYVDILDIGSKFDDYRAVDEAWKLLARVAGEFNALMITATQANKEGHKAANLDASHQSGFYGKNQHVNMMVGLNQTPEEKEQGVIKYGITEARSQHYIQGKTCVVLQDIKAGQVYLDSYYKY